MKKVSIVVPIFNEAGSIGRFLDEKLAPEIQLISKNYRTELILVDDGSTDQTVENLKQTSLVKNFSPENFSLICFSHNFGKEIALAAGIKHASGDAVVMLDADGQHPPEAIIKMLEKWEAGAQIVTAFQKRNHTSHRFWSAIFYKIMHLLGNRTMVAGATDFRLIDREVADEYNRFVEHNRITRGLIDWLGYPQEYLNVTLRGRMSGKGTYDFKKLLSLAGNSFVSMSRTPLVSLGYIGAFIMIFSLFLGLFILIQQYLLGDPLGLDWSGAVAMCTFISFLVGLVLVSQAITALYISQIHTEVKNRPLYVINRAKSIGLSNKTKQGKS